MGCVVRPPQGLGIKIHEGGVVSAHKYRHCGIYQCLHLKRYPSQLEFQDNM